MNISAILDHIDSGHMALPESQRGYVWNRDHLADPVTGEQKAIFDLAWPNGIQEELSQPAAVLLNEQNETLAMASQAGYRCFTSSEEFQRYVRAEILVEEAGA